VSSSSCLNYYFSHESAFKFSSINSRYFPLNYFLFFRSLECKNLKIKTKTLFSIHVMIWNLLFTYLQYCLFRRAKIKLFTVFTEQRFARRFEANLVHSLMTSHLVSEPIKCTHLAPIENCDWQAETHILNSYNCSVFKVLGLNSFYCWQVKFACCL